MAKRQQRGRAGVEGADAAASPGLGGPGKATGRPGEYSLDPVGTQPVEVPVGGQQDRARRGDPHVVLRDRCAGSVEGGAQLAVRTHDGGLEVDDEKLVDQPPGGDAPAPGAVRVPRREAWRLQGARALRWIGFEAAAGAGCNDALVCPPPVVAGWGGGVPNVSAGEARRPVS